jgi:hypothetical protein
VAFTGLEQPSERAASYKIEIVGKTKIEGWFSWPVDQLIWWLCGMPPDATALIVTSSKGQILSLLATRVKDNGGKI